MLPDNRVIIAAIVWLALGLVAEFTCRPSFRRMGRPFEGKHLILCYFLGPVLVPLAALVAFGWAFVKVFLLGRRS